MTIKSLHDLKVAVEDYANERDWDQFHSPKNLAMALSVEAAELLEHFQWLSEDESQNLSEKTHAEVRDEIADVQVYLARLAGKLDIDIYEAVEQKMKKNAEKYPVEKVKGSRKKYTEY